MSQQINLYNAAFIPKREWLTPKSVATGTLLSVLAVSGWAGWVSNREKSINASLVAAQVAQKQAQEALDATRRATSPRAPNAGLVAEAAERKERLAQGEAVLAFLQGGGSRAGVGFAGYLAGLARQHVNGLWLTRFSVATGGAGMTVQGRTVDQALIASYVTRLKGEKAFQGIAFADLKVSAQGFAPAEVRPALASAPATATPAVPPAPTLATATALVSAPTSVAPRADVAGGGLHDFQLTAVRATEPPAAAPATAPAAGGKS